MCFHGDSHGNNKGDSAVNFGASIFRCKEFSKDFAAISSQKKLRVGEKMTFLLEASDVEW